VTKSNLIKPLFFGKYPDRMISPVQWQFVRVADADISHWRRGVEARGDLPPLPGRV
jgi:hypothetical protein